MPDVPLWRPLINLALVVVLNRTASHVLEVYAEMSAHNLAPDVLNDVLVVKFLIDLDLFLNKYYLILY